MKVFGGEFEGQILSVRGRQRQRTGAAASRDRRTNRQTHWRREGRRVKAVDSLWLSKPLIPSLWSGIGEPSGEQIHPTVR